VLIDVGIPENGKDEGFQPREMHKSRFNSSECCISLRMSRRRLERARTSPLAYFPHLMSFPSPRCNLSVCNLSINLFSLLALSDSPLLIKIARSIELCNHLSFSLTNAFRSLSAMRKQCLVQTTFYQYLSIRHELFAVVGSLHRNIHLLFYKPVAKIKQKV
jgi:hypothetical protein